MYPRVCRIATPPLRPTATKVPRTATRSPRSIIRSGSTRSSAMSCRRSRQKVEDSLVSVVALGQADRPSPLEGQPDLHVGLAGEQRNLVVFPARRRPAERSQTLEPAPP